MVNKRSKISRWKTHQKNCLESGEIKIVPKARYKDMENKWCLFSTIYNPDNKKWHHDFLYGVEERGLAQRIGKNSPYNNNIRLYNISYNI